MNTNSYGAKSNNGIICEQYKTLVNACEVLFRRQGVVMELWEIPGWSSCRDKKKKGFLYRKLKNKKLIHSVTFFPFTDKCCTLYPTTLE